MDAAQCLMVCFAVFDHPLQEAGETALHYSVRTADQTSLHLVDFLVQNRYMFLHRKVECYYFTLHFLILHALRFFPFKRISGIAVFCTVR